jgi:hypothetical protein
MVLAACVAMSWPDDANGCRKNVAGSLLVLRQGRIVDTDLFVQAERSKP